MARPVFSRPFATPSCVLATAALRAQVAVHEEEVELQRAEMDRDAAATQLATLQALAAKRAEEIQTLEAEVRDVWMRRRVRCAYRICLRFV